jgi:hypothetical protein
VTLASSSLTLCAIQIALYPFISEGKISNSNPSSESTILRDSPASILLEALK